MERARIGIVGFGVAGATVGALLARQGHAVTVFERATGATGAGLLLQPSGQLVLERVGLLDEVTRMGEPIGEIFAETSGGRHLVRLVYAEVAGMPAGLGIGRPTFLEVLYRVARNAGAAVRTNTRIVGLTETPEGVTLEDERGERHGPLALVVGADGLDSAVRRLGGFERWTYRYRWGALWTVGHSDAIRGRLHMVARGTRDLLGLLPLGNGRCNFFWSQHHDRFDERRARGFAAWRDDVLRLSPLAEEIVAGLHGFDDLRLTSYGHVVTHAPHGGRVVLLGDAAHATSPHLGQGVNFALVDAYDLARAVERAANPSAAIADYVRRRSRQIRFYATLTLALTPFFQSDGFVKGMARDLALPVIERLPYVRYRMLLAMAGMTGGFRGDRFRL